ncbi:MAG: ATP-binding cassette domain-containing protein [Halarcobacter sp.]
MSLEETILKIDNLNFAYKKDQLIYKDFNLELKKGELFSIVGKSGSGKSTLFELICGNLKPLSGEIRTKKISSIYQDPYTSFHPSFSIINQIEDVLEKNSNFREDVKSFCQELSLNFELLNKKPHELSGGQLQRCSILRALMMKPDLLLVDEPTSALDNIIAVDVMKMLIKYLDSCAIVLITHDMTLARWCSDKIIRLD